jgi:hypothetical protein
MASKVGASASVERPATLSTRWHSAPRKALITWVRPNMPNVVIKGDDANNIIAYILSLKEGDSAAQIMLLLLTGGR